MSLISRRKQNYLITLRDGPTHCDPEAGILVPILHAVKLTLTWHCAMQGVWVEWKSAHDESYYWRRKLSNTDRVGS